MSERKRPPKSVRENSLLAELVIAGKQAQARELAEKILQRK
jgi:hypothetical protein